MKVNKGYLQEHRCIEGEVAAREATCRKMTKDRAAWGKSYKFVDVEIAEKEGCKTTFVNCLQT